MQRAEFLDRLRDDALAVGAAGDVAADAERGAAVRLAGDAPPAAACERGAVDVRKHHVGAGAAEAHRHRLPETARGAGDDRDRAVEADTAAIGGYCSIALGANSSSSFISRGVRPCSCEYCAAVSSVLRLALMPWRIAGSRSALPASAEMCPAQT